MKKKLNFFEKRRGIWNNEISPLDIFSSRGSVLFDEIKVVELSLMEVCVTDVSLVET